MIFAASLLLVSCVFLYLFFVRTEDLPAELPPDPYLYVNQLKARIYENLRDLQFEYRVGKLSDEDYALAKQGLQKELAVVIAETDAIRARQGKPADKTASTKKNAAQFVCPHCGAGFNKAMKFCGECGKAMEASA
jgi:hypothetical protein